MKRSWQSGSAILISSLLASLLTSALAPTLLAEEAPTAEKPSEKPPEKPGSEVQVGVRIDCGLDFNRNRGGSQPCAEISGLQLGVESWQSERVRGSFRIDPFATTSRHFQKSPFRADIPRAADYSSTGMVDDYRVAWTPRPNLILAVSKFQGTTELPDQSGLSQAGTFQDSGWDQTAISASYHLPPLSGVDVLIAAGNGEGENGTNLDPQQYMGIRLDASIMEGFHGFFGMSFDGNNAGSAEYRWHYEAKTAPSVGFSTQRLAAGVYLDGLLSAARGLKLGLGWQRAVLTDLDKDVIGVPSSGLMHRKSDPGEFLFEDPSRNDTVVIKRTVLEVTTSYRILDKYFVAGGFESRSVTVGGGGLPFQPCKAVNNGVCDKEGDATSEILQTSYTYGVGFDVTTSLTFVADYSKASFDKLYDGFNYSFRDGAVSTSSETFNARLSYNFKN